VANEVRRLEEAGALAEVDEGATAVARSNVTRGVAASLRLLGGVAVAILLTSIGRETMRRDSDVVKEAPAKKGDRKDEK